MDIANKVGPTQAPTGFAGLVVAAVNGVIQLVAMFGVDITTDQLAQINLVVGTLVALGMAIYAWKRATPVPKNYPADEVPPANAPKG